MRFIKFFVLAAFLLAGQTAMADFKTVTRANEVRLNEFRLPASLNGIASFKACGACGMQTVNVNAATRYRINNEFVSLVEMRRSLAVVSNRDRRTIIVMHHLESDLITQISINL